MSYVIIENFNGGWDTRRLESAGTPGTLLEIVNAHITRGGEIEKRKAFVSKYSLPAGTQGLASTTDQLWVFGSGPDPGVPSGVNYQRLQHPTNPGGTTLNEILSWDTYADKLYVAALFSDGSVHHFYDGVYVENWWDGKARGGFTVAESEVQSGTPSQKSVFIDNDSTALETEVLLVDDEGEQQHSLTGGTVSVGSGDTAFDYAIFIRDAVNANSGTTGIEAGVALNAVIFRAVDPNVNLFGYRVVFLVSETSPSGFQVSIAVEDTKSKSCSAAGGCSNDFTLVPTVSNGSSPFTYEWTIENVVSDALAVFVDTGGSTSALEEPTVRVTANTTSQGTTASVSVKLKVIDNGASETFDTITLSSEHFDSRGTLA